MVFGFFKSKKTKEIAPKVEEVVKQELPVEGKVEEVIESIAEEISETIEESKILERVDAAVEAFEIKDELLIQKSDQGIEAAEKFSVPESGEAEIAETEIAPKAKMSWTQRLKLGLTKTRDTLGKKLLGVFGGGKIDENLYEELETILLSSDMGFSATNRLLDQIRKKVSLKGLKDCSELKALLKDGLIELLNPIEKPLITDRHQPFIIMLVGVNGAGKTTSIGKLAKYFQSQGKSVMLAAGDTFRAAAREQLIEWGKRNNVTVVSQDGGDSAAVCYDAIQSAIAHKIDIVLADTAGRLPTQLNLMEEIKKVKRVIGKAVSGAPHEVLLVLDSNIGQNALNQVRAFDDALQLSGLILTKLDGTAKGGVICAIARERPIPLRFIGVGETIDDLRPFVAKDYVSALFD